MRTNRLALAAMIAAVPGSAAFAAGLMHGADGRELAIEAQSLEATVEGTLATTEVLQTFRNDSEKPAEAVYDFTLPPRATFSGLSIWVDGKEVQGEIVGRSRAESVYSEVTGVDVRRHEEEASAAAELGRETRAPVRAVHWRGPFAIKRDPALLEHRSGSELRLRVAPVPARGTQRVRIRYVEPLAIEAGEGRYSFAVAKGSALDAKVTVGGEVALAKRCTADVDVRWKLPEADAPAVSVVAGKKHALVTLTPWLPQVASVARDVVIVLDSSEGMRAHLRDASDALEGFLGELRLQDRFDVVSFNLAARSCKGKLVPASTDARNEAREFLRGTRFELGSDPRTALVATAKIARATESTRPLDIVIVTSAGFSESDELVRSVEEQARASGARIFALEVGAQPSAPLVRLCERTGGAARRGSPARAAAKELSRILATPVLRAPSLRFEGVELADVHPAAPPVSLRHGTPVIVTGRVEKAGRGRALLEGTLADGRRMSWAIPFELPAKGDVPEADRLHAQGAADDLLAALAEKDLQAHEQARLERELERVSLAGPILTKATSLIVLESEAMFEEFGISRDNRDLVTEERAAAEERRKAVEQAVEARRLEARSRKEEALAANVAPQRIWQAPKLGGFGGHGGGAGEPVFVLLGLGLAASALRGRRAA